MDTYTGFLRYRNIEFTFVFTNNELKLITPNEKVDWIKNNWLTKQIGSGLYIDGDTMYVEEDYIIGSCNETHNSIVFIPQFGSVISSNCNIFIIGIPVFTIKLDAYIMYKYNREYICNLAFSGPEINYIHPVNQAFAWNHDIDEIKRGIYKIETRDFSATTTPTQTFTVDGKTILSRFGITRRISNNINELPLSSNSSLIFDFENTKDFSFIIRLCKIAEEYISFLCYRKNIVFSEIKIASPYPDGKHEAFGTIHFVKENIIEEKPLKDDRVIKQALIKECECKILQDISDNLLYLRHIPETFKISRHIDASRFVMITAAFEWEFRRIHPDGIDKSEKTQQAEKNVSKEIQALINSHKGREKKIFKGLKKLIKTSSLQNEIEFTCNDLDSIIGEFGKQLYSLNHETLNYSDMGQRLADQRNHFAHGDLDKDFIGTSLLDLMFLEYVIYAMLLKNYGIEDLNIQKSINGLFHLNHIL